MRRKASTCGFSGTEKLDRAAPEGLELFAQRDHPAHPPQHRVQVVFLLLHVDGLIVVLVIDNHRQDQPLRIGGREARVAIAAPLHRRAHAVAVAEIDVVAHPDLVAVVDDRGAGQRQQQAIHQLDRAAIVAEQRREPAPDAEVDAHPRFPRVGAIHISRAPPRSPSRASARRDCAGRSPTGRFHQSAASAPRYR